MQFCADSFAIRQRSAAQPNGKGRYRLRIVFKEELFSEFFAKVLAVANYNPDHWPARHAWTGTPGAALSHVTVKVVRMMAEFYEDLGAGRMVFTIRTEKAMGDGTTLPEEVRLATSPEGEDDDEEEHETYQDGDGDIDMADAYVGRVAHS